MQHEYELVICKDLELQFRFARADYIDTEIGLPTQHRL